MFLSPTEGFAVLAIFAVAMIVIVAVFSRRISGSLEEFVLANRNVGWLSGGFSVAVTFIWAPAIFVSSQRAYEDGFPGIFWFVIPNVLTLLSTIVIVPLLLRRHPNGFTFAEYVATRLGPNGWHGHLSLLFINYAWMVLAVIFNCVAGGLLLSTISGVDFSVTAPAMVIIALAYSILSGLRASVVTDLIQMAVILFVVLVFVPWTLLSTGDLSLISQGFGGFDSGSVDPLTWSSFYLFGLLPFIGLWGGWIQDPTFYQRAFAIRRKHSTRAFLVAAIAFLVVPSALSFLGFAAAGLEVSGAGLGEGIDPQMVGPLMIGEYLPKIALLFFTFMAFAGLGSTLDSAFVATGALTSIDVYKRYISPNASEGSSLAAGRIAMVVVAAVGLLFSFLKPNLFWLFLTISAIAVGGIIPTVTLIMGGKLPAWAITLSVWLCLAIALPTAIYGNIVNNADIHIQGTLVALLASMVISIAGVFGNRRA